jgi:hypothetical protein
MLACPRTHVVSLLRKKEWVQYLHNIKAQHVLTGSCPNQRRPV